MDVLTDRGFDRPSLDELITAQSTRAKELFGEKIDTSQTSVLGKFIRLVCVDLDNAYQELEECYFARFPDTASGQSLDRLVTFAGIKRNPALPAYHEIKFIGTANADIPAGFLVGTVNNVNFHTIYDLSIGDSSEVVGMVEANIAGTSGNVPLGTINTIVNPSAVVSSIEHLSVVQLGTAVESDTELRKRFKETLAGGGSSTYAAIKAEILRVPQVVSVILLENDTDMVVGDLPPHSFCCYVDAPDSQNQLIAEAIFHKKPVGIQSIGTVAVDVIDVAGDVHTIHFNKVTQKNIYCKITVAKTAEFQTTGVADIKTAIMNTVNYLKNGEDVIISNLYVPVLNVVGAKDITELKLSTDGIDYANENIAISDAQVAKTTTDKIEVTVVDYVDR